MIEALLRKRLFFIAAMVKGVPALIGVPITAPGVFPAFLARPTLDSN